MFRNCFSRFPHSLQNLLRQSLKKKKKKKLGDKWPEVYSSVLICKLRFFWLSLNHRDSLNKLYHLCITKNSGKCICFYSVIKPRISQTRANKTWAKCWEMPESINDTTRIQVKIDYWKEMHEGWKRFRLTLLIRDVNRITNFTVSACAATTAAISIIAGQRPAKTRLKRFWL